MFVWVGGWWLKTKSRVWLRSIPDLPDPHLTWTWPGPGPELDNINFYSPCGNAAIVAWCNKEEITDIYEVSTEEDFRDCSNLPDYLMHISKFDYDIEGFVLHPRTKPRYFVSKSLCKYGFKVKVSFDINCSWSLHHNFPCMHVHRNKHIQLCKFLGH